MKLVWFFEGLEGGGGAEGLIEPHLFFHIFWLYCLLTLVFTCSCCSYKQLYNPDSNIMTMLEGLLKKAHVHLKQ